MKSFRVIFTLIFSTSAWLFADSNHMPFPQFEASASHDMKVAPDEVYFSINVITENKKAKVATAENAQKVNQGIRVLKNSGLTTKEYKTTNFRLEPVYSYKGKTSTLSKYRVQNQIQVQLKDLKKLGKIVDQLIGAGINNVSSFHFDRSDKEIFYNKALAKATEKALEKINLLASTAGFSGTKVVRLSESSSLQHSVRRKMAPRMEMKAMSMDSAPTQIQNDEIKISASVHLVSTKN